MELLRNCSLRINIDSSRFESDAPIGLTRLVNWALLRGSRQTDKIALHSTVGRQIAEIDVGQLQELGWAHVGGIPLDDVSNAVWSVAKVLGPVVHGRWGKPVETIRPQASENAPLASLSAQFGFGVLPFHIDGSHRAVPCRYIVLGCLESSPQPVPTLLVRREVIAFDAFERRLARTAIFHISNGRNSFYASICGADQRYIRYDPGCMRPTSESARSALRLFEFSRLVPYSVAFQWTRGDVLVIDNWRTLHGRGCAQENAQRRSLVRCTVA